MSVKLFCGLCGEPAQDAIGGIYLCAPHVRRANLIGAIATAEAEAYSMERARIRQAEREEEAA